MAVCKPRRMAETLNPGLPGAPSCPSYLLSGDTRHTPIG
jgi:hypothetical protein